MNRDLLQSVLTVLLCCVVIGMNARAAEANGSLKEKFVAPPSGYRAVTITGGWGLANPKLPD